MTQTIRILGVIGAGTIGTGVALNFAQHGFSVILIDISNSILEASRKKIARDLRFSQLYQKESTSTHHKNEILNNIRYTTDYMVLEKAEFIIENVTEKLEVKREVYKKIDEIAPAACIFGANTSCTSITKIGSFTNRADQVIGIHFMNPVPLIDSVETIIGHHTSRNTIDTTTQLLASINKETVEVQDFPGFVSNRISHLFMNEAMFVVQDQVASASKVDKIFKRCFGHKMGPLQTADLIGLDTVLYSLEVLYEKYNDSKYRPSPLLRKMVDAGLLGVKSGKGFYSYE